MELKLTGPLASEPRGDMLGDMPHTPPWPCMLGKAVAGLKIEWLHLLHGLIGQRNTRLEMSESHW